MGYTTYFEGTLLFTEELTESQVLQLKSMSGEDCRDHPEWGNTSLTYIDLVLNDDNTGLIWDAYADRTTDLPEKVNLIIDVMRRTCPTFGLRGELLAQGEEAYDRWKLIINDAGYAETVYLQIVDSTELLTCPHCQKKFALSTIQTKEKTID